jgi:hypothetical protein
MVRSHTALPMIGLALGLAVTARTPAAAGGLCASFVISCQNGHDYALCPIAVSDAGEVVTAHLALRPRHGIHVRLVPMGVGYRYIAPGIWLDGVRGEAILNFGKYNSVACTVARN